MLLDYRSLFESAPSLHLVLTPSFDIVAVTDAYLDATMTRREQMLGRNIFEVFPDNPDDPHADGVTRLRASLDRVLQSRRSDAMAVQKYDIRRPEALGGGFEERFWSPVNSPVLDDGGAVVHIIHRVEDVTDFVRMKEELQSRGATEVLARSRELGDANRQLEEELRQAQKMEAVGRLAGGIAHDFNNLLTVILGYCNILLSRVETFDPNHRKLSDIRDAGEKAADLTRQLLIFSRKQVLEPRVVNLAAMLQDTDRMLRRVLGEDVEVATIIDGDPGQVRIDPSQAQQVLMNLVVNARDAMPRGGKLTIELRNMLLEPGSEKHYGIPSGEYVALAVTDTGIGMNEDVKQHLFEPFFTTKDANQGTGLGLSTVYGIVKQSGGHIWLYSELGAGTTFKIFLPRVDQAPDPIAAPADLKLSTGSETILVVENDDRIRSLVEEVLSSAGYTVLAAGSGERALQLCEQSSGKIELMLTDVVLPKMNGREIADQIAQRRPNTKVLFMSGYTGNAMIHRDVLSQPKMEFLQKPFTPQALCRKVREVLDSGLLPLRRILVVDDMPAVLDLIGTQLEDLGFDVTKASGGREARERAQSHPVDIVLTDLSMPEEEGIETIRALRAKHPELKIIAMSGAFGPEILQSARALGADAALAKPISPEKLLECIQSLSKAARLVMP